MPGEIGNVALAGHRVGKGSPFLELDTLRPGDPIVLETRDSWFVYRVLGDRDDRRVRRRPQRCPGPGDRAARRDVDVISPVPDRAPGVEPTEAPPDPDHLSPAVLGAAADDHPRASGRRRR